MTLKECYSLLKVDQSASLEDVKRAYRRRAFELHPDLNPNVSDASRQFQLLNEAYVILTRLATAREAAAAEAAAKQAKGDHTRPGPRWYEWGFSFGSKKTDAESTADAESEAAKQEEARKARQSSEERRAQREEAYREEIRREEERQRERRREETRRETARKAEQQRKAAEQARAEKARTSENQRPQSEQSTAGQPKSEQPDTAQATTEQSEAGQQTTEQSQAGQSQTGRPERPESPERPRRPDSPERPQSPPRSETIRPERPRTARPGTTDNVYAEQQEVLRDILNDDFARRVFEDIYSEIRKKTPPPEREVHRHPPREATRPRAENVQAESVPPKSKGGLPFGLDHFRLDFSGGVGNTVKGWLRSQIDEEQTIKLPATGLFPGARVRLQIRRGLSDDLTTIEVTLPPDFVPGKPIRLRGLGKKLGSMQGDLYLTVIAR